MRKFLLDIALFFVVIPGIGLTTIELGARAVGVVKISHHRIVAKSQSLVPEVGPSSIVFLGDSRVEWGVKPSVVGAQLGARENEVLNLAMPGSNGLDILRYLKAKGISPRVLVIGYTPNAGRYRNHGLDLIRYSLFNRLIENLVYQVRQRLIISDGSIQNYIRNGPPYFNSHQYDRYGGVTVIENGGYAERKEFQLRMYDKWAKTFSRNALSNYRDELNRLLGHFKKRDVLVVGIYMPVSDSILDLESGHGKIDLPQFEQYLDWSRHYAEEARRRESDYFYDGAHLAHERSCTFSEELGKSIKQLIEN